jgi:hypothetical protein
MTINISDDDERRRFFRIDDEVILEFQAISETQYSKADEELEEIQNSAFGLSADFATLNHEYNPVLHSIKNHLPEVAHYFELINSKLDKLSHHILDRELITQGPVTQNVNLSAAGIAFECSETFTDNQPMKIRLVLLPEKIGILVFGRVRRKISDKKNLLCIDFEHLRYNDQELMIKHNLNRQMEELRQRSEEKNNQ